MNQDGAKQDLVPLSNRQPCPPPPATPCNFLHCTPKAETPLVTCKLLPIRPNMADLGLPFFQALKVDRNGCLGAIYAIYAVRGTL